MGRLLYVAEPGMLRVTPSCDVASGVHVALLVGGGDPGGGTRAAAPVHLLELVAAREGRRLRARVQGAVGGCSLTL